MHNVSDITIIWAVRGALTSEKAHPGSRNRALKLVIEHWANLGPESRKVIRADLDSAGEPAGHLASTVNALIANDRKATT